MAELMTLDPVQPGQDSQDREFADQTAMDRQLHSTLERAFGLSSFRKGQKAILESVLRRRDTLAVMPTGGGKSLCYQLPSVVFDGLVVVTSPLIALMKDQVRILKALGLRAGCLHSGQSLDDKRTVFQDIQKGGAYVLYLSPERVQSPGFAPWIKERKVALFAIDEAHCVSQWGPDFREDYHKLSLLREMKPEVPILALTATATPQVLRDVSLQLRLKDPDRHVYGFYRPNLFYQVEICPDEAYKARFLFEAVGKTADGRILIYCGTRQQCEDVSASLSHQFDGVGYYHAGMSADDRKSVQEKVDRGEIRILAATNAFGMGIDYPDVRLVVHFQMPANVESLYQEMGRAGRDGKMALCLLLYSRKDRGLQSFFIQQSKADAAVIRRRWDSLHAITQFIEGGECRHAGILTYFKDTDRITTCGHCDACAPSSPLMVTKPQITVSKAADRKVKIRKAASKGRREFEITSPEAEARQILLRDWRREYAKANDIPAFIVFSDRTLTDLSNRNPTSRTELAEVYGFGPSKVELLGPLLLKELGHAAE